MGGKGSPLLAPNNIFEKDFECPVCYDIMVPPSRYNKILKEINTQIRKNVPQITDNISNCDKDIPVQQRPPVMRSLQVSCRGKDDI